MDDSADTPDSPDPTPETLFVDWLARRESDEPLDFEALCGEHPAHAARLKDLRAEWDEIEGILQRAGLGGSLAERLSTRYGSEVDPQISLAEDAPGSGGFSSDVLKRLAGRCPDSERLVTTSRKAAVQAFEDRQNGVDAISPTSSSRHLPPIP